MPQELFFVILPNGRRSRLASRATILDLFASNKLPAAASVGIDGTDFRIPLDQFASDSGDFDTLMTRVLSNATTVRRRSSKLPRADLSRFMVDDPDVTPAASSVANSVPGSVPGIVQPPQLSASDSSVRRTIERGRPAKRSAVVLVAFVLLASGFIAGRASARWSSLNNLARALNPARAFAGNAAAGNVVAGVDEDSIRDAVRTYLAGNLDSGEWDEVEWHPAVAMTQPAQWDVLWSIRANMIAGSGNDVFASLQGLNRRQPANGPLILARLVFRSTNAFGQQVRSDVAFEFADGIASPIADDLQPLMQRAWTALEAGQHGIAIEVPPTDEEQARLEGQAAFMEWHNSLLNNGPVQR
jgi:hypothetical protein